MRRFCYLFFIILIPLTSKGQTNPCLNLPEPLFLQAPDSICAEKKDLIIKTSRIKESGVKYLWQTPVGPMMTTDSILRIPSPTARYSGNYSLIIQIDTCKSAPFGPINIQVIGAAKASSDPVQIIPTCNSSEIQITSTYKTSSSVSGKWVGTEGVTFDSINAPTTVVKNLKEGGNYAIWVLSTSVCPSFLNDSFLIQRNVKPKLETSGISLRAGQSSTTIHLGKVAGSNLDILNDIDIRVTVQPKHGTVEKMSDGKRLKYSRNGEFSGLDAFKIKVCNSKCLNLCSDEIPFTVELIFDPDYPNVGMRKVIAPKQSGEARLFLIENIEKYPKNELQIMNRWGQIVFKFKDYKNTGAWDGTDGNGGTLSGAFYYFFHAKDKDDKLLKPLSGIFYIVDE